MQWGAWNTHTYRTSHYTQRSQQAEPQPTQNVPALMSTHHTYKHVYMDLFWRLDTFCWVVPFPRRAPGFPSAQSDTLKTPNCNALASQPGTAWGDEMVNMRSCEFLWEKLQHTFNIYRQHPSSYFRPPGNCELFTRPSEVTLGQMNRPNHRRTRFPPPSNTSNFSLPDSWTHS